MSSQWIDIGADDGKQFKSYLALPPAGKGPGILLIQEIFGVNRHIRTVADQYALDGYVVLAPDLFWRQEPGLDIGYTPADVQRGIALMQKFDFPRGVADLGTAVAALRARPECAGKVASLGFCMGGLLSYLCAAQAGVDGAISYYAGGIAGRLAQAQAVRCPIVFHFGGRDNNIGPDAVDAVRKAFAGRSDAAVHVYPQAEHAFANWDRAAYNQPAAVLAHGRTLEFLAGLLGG